MAPDTAHTTTAPSESPAPATRRRPLATPAPRRGWLTGLALGVVAAVTAFLLFPHAPDGDAVLEGDPELVADLETAVDPDLVQGLVTARFPVDDPDSVAWANGGTADGTAPVGPDTPFETASVFKAFTAMTLADMVENGETSLDRTLEEVFPEVDFADPEVAGATLEEVATHHAGLSPAPVGDPGGILRAQVLGDLYRTSLPAREYLPEAQAVLPGTFMYSNVGYAVLGEALAEESGTPYEELVRERVLDPLGMDDTVISGDGVPEGGAGPHIGPGARVEDWRNTDYAAAGIGTWSTPADLVRFATAVADGTAPGLAALEPVHPEITPGAPSEHDASDASQGISVGAGLGWFRWEHPGAGEMTWTSGGLTGVRTMVALGEEEAVVIMANSFTVEAPALAGELLSDSPEQVGNGIAPVQGVLTVAGLTIPPLLLLSLMARRRTLITQRPLDRLRVVSLSLGATAWTVLFLRMGSWTLVPHALWAVAVGAVLTGITVGAWHFRRVPVEAGRWRWLHVPVFAMSVAISLVLGGAGLWGMLIAW